MISKATGILIWKAPVYLCARDIQRVQAEREQKFVDVLKAFIVMNKGLLHFQ